MNLAPINFISLQLCPRSWKLLFLFNEFSIPFKINIELAESGLIFPILDGYNSDFAYIFENFEKFIETNSRKTMGFWIQKIECVFIPEIVMPIRYERFIKPVVKREVSSLSVLKEKRLALKESLLDFSLHLQNNSYICGSTFSLIDITLASAIGVLDYFGEVVWKTPEFKDLANWYAKIKSRPTFKDILNQRGQGISPHPKFSLLDF